MELDVWECDICHKRVEKIYPDTWRGIFCNDPTSDDEVKEMDICDECLATKALRDVPWPISDPKESKE